jgi:hypothetical protein
VFTVTAAAGIPAGQTWAGLIKYMMGGRGKLTTDKAGNKVLNLASRQIYAERDTLPALSDYSCKMYLPLPLRNTNENYSDPTPVSATEARSYYTILGNFRPGIYYFKVALLSVTSEFTNATDFEGNVGVGIICMDNKISYDKYSAKNKYDATGISMKGNGVYVKSTLANIVDIVLDGNPIGDVQLEWYKRIWLLANGSNFDDALLTDDLGWEFAKDRVVAITYNTGTDNVLVERTDDGQVKKKRSRRRRRRPGRRRLRRGRRGRRYEEAEAIEYEDGDYDEYDEDDDDYESAIMQFEDEEVDPSAGTML